MTMLRFAHGRTNESTKAVSMQLGVRPRECEYNCYARRWLQEFAGGREFDPPRLHQIQENPLKSAGSLFFLHVLYTFFQ